LKEHREQAAKAAMASGFSVRMMEYFPASGDKPSLEACREKVAEAEVVVAIVAHRYGWVPDGPGNPNHKSITWLECDHARAAGKEVLAFLVDPDYPWPPQLREDYRLVQPPEPAGDGRQLVRSRRVLPLGWSAIALGSGMGARGARSGQQQVSVGRRASARHFAGKLRSGP
jgi:hypothetical protein